MKKIIVVLAGVLFAFAVNAQDTKTEAKPQAAPGAVTKHPMHDYMTMKDGKMMVMKDGKMAAMDKDMDLSNGDKLMMDGNVVKKDGSKMMMKEGDRMMMNGTMRSAADKKKPAEKMEKAPEGK